MQNEVQLVHGIRVAEEVSIVGAPTVPGDRADLHLQLDAPAPTSDSAPPGELVASLDAPSARYEAALEGEVLTIRFHEAAEFEIDLATGRGRARPHPGQEALLPVLLAGNVLAIVLGLRGVGVIHASTVALDEAVLMVAGPSGAGKSTLAALVCAAGGLLIGDDTARIEDSGGNALVHPGAGELRLRPQAAGLADRIQGDATRTADGRIALRPRLVADRPVAPTALLLPAWRHEDEAPVIQPLRAREALEALLGCARVIGWHAHGPLKANLDAFTLLAQTTTAFRIELPRGHLDDPGFPAAIRGALAGAGALAGPPSGS